VLEAIKRGKHVVTANKALLLRTATRSLLLRTAGVMVAFEAAVAAASRSSKALREA